MEKSEILFLYETSYNIPNGDPFTGEQRYDDESKRILVSDVRVKRFIRTYLEDCGLSIYVSNKTGADKKDAKSVLAWIGEHQKGKQIITDVGELLKTMIDVRLFGGISTLEEKDKVKLKIGEKKVDLTNPHCQLTGPVQFALLNPSLNEVNLLVHQNTSHFASREENSQGAISTTSIVPYSLMQIHGWVNPRVAQTTGMNEEDFSLMLQGL
uniref:Type I-B CRISPR-associated protein Cas7/Csh2 n=1 Tax=Prevotella sp. GTC17260 TaxID=3236796 RepID=A0AB33JET8_9BACT